MAAALPSLAPFPFSLSELETVRFDARNARASGGIGVHLRRKLGQSLDYREHAHYTPGDDVRLIDWRMSLKHGGTAAGQRWFVRRFEAEENLTLVVAVDTRRSMHLPEAAPKIRVAMWIAEALMHIVTREKWQASFMTLQGLRSGNGRKPLAGGALRAAFGAWHQTIATTEPQDAPIVVEPIIEMLPPAAALVVISDFLCGWEVPAPPSGVAVEGEDRDRSAFAKLLTMSQHGFRQTILVRLDSWPAERRMLEATTVDILSVASTPLFESPRKPTTAELNQAEQDYHAKQRALLETIPRHGLVLPEAWTWPKEIAQLNEKESQATLEQWFRESFYRFLGSSGLVRRAW